MRGKQGTSSGRPRGWKFGRFIERMKKDVANTQGFF
jgi:hypothetical protein